MNAPKQKFIKILRQSSALALGCTISFLFLNLKPAADTNAKLKAVFIYNFTKYIEWPSEAKEGDFVIGIFGPAESLSAELQQMAKVQKAGLQSISVRTFNSFEECSKCHILFVVPEKSDKLLDLITKYKGQSTLIVTEKSGLIDKGAAINFITAENKQKFELHQANVKRNNLEVSSKLLPFASVVK